MTNGLGVKFISSMQKRAFDLVFGLANLVVCRNARWAMPAFKASPFMDIEDQFSRDRWL